MAHFPKSYVDFSPATRTEKTSSRGSYLSERAKRGLLITGFVLSVLLIGAGLLSQMGQASPGGIFAPISFGDLATNIVLGAGGLLFLAVAIATSKRAKGKARALLITAFVFSAILLGAGACSHVGQINPNSIFSHVSKTLGDLGTNLVVGAGGLLYIGAMVTNALYSRKKRGGRRPKEKQVASDRVESLFPEKRSSRSSRSGRSRKGSSRRPKGESSRKTGFIPFDATGDRVAHFTSVFGPGGSPGGGSPPRMSGAATRENSGQGPADALHVGGDRVEDL